MMTDHATQIVSVLIGLPVAIVAFYAIWIIVPGLILFAIGKFLWFFRYPLFIVIKLMSYATIAGLIYVGFAIIMLCMGDAQYIVGVAKTLGNAAMGVLNTVDTIQRNIGNAISGR